MQGTLYTRAASSMCGAHWPKMAGTKAFLVDFSLVSRYLPAFRVLSSFSPFE